MKVKILIFLFYLLTIPDLFSQVIPCYYYEISFEGTGTLEYNNCHWLYNDTISNPNNIWQIGPPQKTSFSTAYSNPNVIITDTINTYPVNDTSSFIIGHIATLGITMVNQISFWARYNVNSDTLTDYGTIEFSPDNGLSWIDLFNPVWTCGSCYTSVFGSPATVLSGNSGGWQELYAVIGGLNPTYNIQEGDTVLWRFSFRSDGIETFKDGLMYDSIYMIDSPPVGIDNVDGSEDITVYPNPLKSVLNIRMKDDKQDAFAEIFNFLGEKMYSGELNGTAEVNVGEYAAGIYFVRVRWGNNILTKKIIKE